jgi:cell division protein FtsB
MACYVELNLMGDVKLFESSGLLSRRLLKKTGKIESLKFTPSQCHALITDESTIDRIYDFPSGLSGKQIEVAVKQKLLKDLEFIVPLDDIEFVFSMYKSENSYKVLATAIKKSSLVSLPKFKSISATQQLIASFVSLKTKETFLLVHVFKSEFIVFVFRNGLVDYVRTFKNEGSPDNAIETALEYYKERRKTNIEKFFYSGEFRQFSNTKFDIKPISTILSVKDVDFLTPEIAPHTKYPTFYRVPLLTPKKATIILSIASLGFLGVSSYFYKIKTEEIRTLEKRNAVLQTRLDELQNAIDETQREIRRLKKKLKSEKFRILSNLKKIPLGEFLLYLEKLPKSSKIMTFKFENGLAYLTSITFCRNLNSPTEYEKLISFLKNFKDTDTVELIHLNIDIKNRAIVSEIKIKLREQSYVKP